MVQSCLQLTGMLRLHLLSALKKCSLEWKEKCFWFCNKKRKKMTLLSWSRSTSHLTFFFDRLLTYMLGHWLTDQLVFRFSRDQPCCALRRERTVLDSPWSSAVTGDWSWRVKPFRAGVGHLHYLSKEPFLIPPTKYNASGATKPLLPIKWR